MAEDHLQKRFPKMRPLQSPPFLFSINGFGCMAYGSRDYDEETDTFVKTHCLTLLFFPVIALGAYRVATAPHGWYFLGKVPLSGLGRTWNFLMLACAVAGLFITILLSASTTGR